MIEQLKTIRAGLETATCYSMLGVDAHSVQIALTALTQLEAMAGEQNPVKEPIEVLWQVRSALALACAICDAVPSREPSHLGKLVNAQPDGTHGYRKIHDAEAALAAYLTTPTAAPVAQQYEAGDMASAFAQGFRDGVASVQQGQEPVAWLVCSVNSDGSLSLEHAAAWKEAAHEHINDAITEHGIEEAASWVVRPAYVAAPVAQQRKTVTNDEQASAYMDARLWEFIDMAGMWPRAKPDPRIWAHVMVYAPADQQPQAEAVPSLSPICLELSAEPGCRYKGLCVNCAAPQQAEAVPPGYVLVPVEPTAGMCKAAADAWLDCGSRLVLNKAGAAVRAAIAQQKGGV